jgi:hypothetical protein
MKRREIDLRLIGVSIYILKSKLSLKKKTNQKKTKYSNSFLQILKITKVDIYKNSFIKLIIFSILKSEKLLFLI